MKRLTTPLQQQQMKALKAGEKVLLDGVLYVARDQAHQRMIEALRKKHKLPIDLRGQVIYYCGPTATPHGKIIGSCGPTTSGRMDVFTAALLRAGLKGMIGKGRRSSEVIKHIKKHKAVYFLAYAGCGALLAQYVKKAEVIAYPELGPEALRRFEVEGFPLIVAVDSRGTSIYPRNSI